MRKRDALGSLIPMAACVFVMAVLMPVPVHALYDIHWVENAEARGAVCNDGSPAAYYFREGFGLGADNWVIFLQGGGLCFDVPSCQQRWKQSPSLMSSKGYAATFDGTGILSEDPDVNTYLHDANLVFVPYCTSDFHTGAWNRSANGGDWHFQGKNVVRAVVQDVQKLAKGMNQDSMVLLAGCSAGGQGVVNNLDFVASLLPSSGVKKYGGMADAGWLMDIKPMDSHIASIDEQVRAAYTLWTPQVAEGCTQGHACLYSTVAIETMQTPIMVHTEQFDWWQLSTALGWQAPPFNKSQAEEAFVAHVGQQFHTSLETQIHEPSAVFAGSCFAHCFTRDAYEYTQLRVGGQSIRDALGNWFFRGGQVKLIDDCGSFNCTQGCVYYG